MTAFDTCYPSLIDAEGGYSNNPRDPGGMTMLGVTKRAWESWVGHPVTESDMRALTKATVAPFYRVRYWNAAHCDSLPIGLALCVFHSAVNDGERRTAMLLQGVVGATPDGAIGPATIAAVKLHDQKSLIASFQDALRAYYRSLPTFPTFGKGWFNRAASVQQQALVLAS